MKFKQLHTTLLLPLCAALTACSDEVLDALNPDKGKTPIELTVGGVETPSTTRAVITDGTGHTLQSFNTNTKIFMIMKSVWRDLGNGYSDLNYGGANPSNDFKKDKYTVTRGEVAANSTDVTFNTDVQKRYWDDAHARSSKLTIWAYAQMGQNWTECTFEEPNTNSTDPLEKYKDYPCQTNAFPQGPIWRETEIYPAIRYWRASNQNDDSQNGTTVVCQDLLFSNNIADNTTRNGSDRRLSFDPTTNHFPNNTDKWTDVTPTVNKTKMIFYHAMSKITIHIKKGSGFDTGDFGFTGSGNVKLKGFNKKGLFHISDGMFEHIWTTKPDHTTEDPNPYDIPKIYNHPSADQGDAMTLEALVIPNIHDFLQSQSTPTSDIHSRFVENVTDVMMEFTINNNKYQITSGQLYTAFHGKQGATDKTYNSKNYIPLEAGKNYDLTLTIGKALVNNITAQVVPWETVNATYSPTNARIEIDVEDDRGKNGATPIQLYRAHDDAQSITDEWVHYEWEKGYTDNVTLTYDSESQKYSMQSGTEWYWESNMTYYHFRTVQPSTHTVTAGSTDNNASEDDKCDYITLTSSDTGITETNDVKWGAPFKDLTEDSDNKPTQKFKYNFGKGFDVDMGDDNEHQIYKAIGPTLKPITIIPFHMMSDVTIKLKTVDGNKAVTLTGATVKLVNAYAEGKVLMGNGKIIGTGNLTTEDNTNSTINYNSTADGKYIYKYGAVPQDLANVSLIIQTTDHNRYIVPMASIFTTTAPSTTNIENPYQANNDKYYIDKWYPGFKYKYELELSKTGINNFRATIVNWETVTADSQGVQIK